MAIMSVLYSCSWSINILKAVSHFSDKTFHVQRVKLLAFFPLPGHQHLVSRASCALAIIANLIFTV
jgi:hypothetical protein